MIAGGDSTGGAILSSAEIYVIDGTAGEPVEEPPIEEEPVEEPVDPPIGGSDLSFFTDLASVPIGLDTVLASELSSGLSLFTFTGIPSAFATPPSPTPAGLEVAETHEMVPVSEALKLFVGPVNYLAYLTPEGEWLFHRRGAPDFLQTLEHLYVGRSYFVDIGAPGAFLYMAPLLEAREITVGPGWYQFGFTGLMHTNIRDFFRDVPQLRSLFFFNQKYYPVFFDGPRVIDQATEMSYGAGAIGFFTGRTSLRIPATNMTHNQSSIWGPSLDLRILGDAFLETLNAAIDAGLRDTPPDGSDAGRIQDAQFPVISKEELAAAIALLNDDVVFDEETIGLVFDRFEVEEWPPSHGTYFFDEFESFR